MSNLILCKKLNKELPALEVPPMPGPKGIEIMNSVSAEAWEMWKSHQTTLIMKSIWICLMPKIESGFWIRWTNSLTMKTMK